MKKFLYKITVIGLASLSLLMFNIPTAQAAFLGQNGKIVWSDIEFSSEGAPVAAPVQTVDFGGGTVLNILDDISSGRAAGAVRYSADGAKIVFTSTDFMTGAANIFVANSDGSAKTQITTVDPADPTRDQNSAMYASFDDSGQRIAYGAFWLDTGTWEQYCHIHAVNSDGTADVALTDDPNFCDAYPVFSPDGTKIAFLRYNKITGITAIYSMNADGSDQSPLVQLLQTSSLRPDRISTLAPLDGGGTVIDWSADGTEIVYADIERVGGTVTAMIRIVNTGSGVVRDVMSDVLQDCDTVEIAGECAVVYYHQPQFAPGGQIVLRGVRSAEERYYDADNDQWSSQDYAATAYIYTINADGGGIQTIATGPTYTGSEAGRAFYGLSMPSVQPLVRSSGGGGILPTGQGGGLSPGSGEGSADLANTGIDVAPLLLLASGAVSLSGALIMRQHYGRRSLGE